MNKPHLTPVLPDPDAPEGLLCSVCGSGESEVKDSRPHQLGIRRRRMCKDCGARWTTIECRSAFLPENLPAILLRMENLNREYVHIIDLIKKVDAGARAMNDLAVDRRAWNTDGQGS